MGSSGSLLALDKYGLLTPVNNQFSYITFARKYRPTNFLELLGQEVLTKILNYSIINNRLSQGYLLTGTRGVGKTSSARIIAKTINCTSSIVNDGNITPCEKCTNCSNFNEHSHPDIIEMDAASKTSVDDIRRIIEHCEYKPMLGIYKVFIIDEVHMLSKGAFNALLKILEEPPAHVIFIFATTEVQKIPLTVISRCQRYDLRRLAFDEIFTLLQKIATKENLNCDPSAFRLIALHSDGSAREAIALLDQAATLSQGDIISGSTLINMLGLVEVDNIISFLKYIISNDANAAIALVSKIYNLSGGLDKFIESISDFIAYLMKAKTLPNYSNHAYELYANEVKDILARISFSQLSILWQIYKNGVFEVKSSHNQLVETEILALKSIYSNSLPLIEELLDDKVARNKVDGPKNENLETITSFLRYLRSNNEMEVYYLLLNNIEISIFQDNLLEVCGQNINKKFKDQIAKLLFTWTGTQWNVNIKEGSKIISIKDKLINNIKLTKDWQLLKENFPEIDISDILLEN